MNFIKTKISRYFETSNTPIKCINYLKAVHPHIPFKYDHMAFRSLYHKDFNYLSEQIEKAGYIRANETLDLNPLAKGLIVNKYAHWFKHKNLNEDVPRVFLSQGYPQLHHEGIMNASYLSEKKRFKRLKKTAKDDDYVFWTWLYSDEINHLAVDMSEYGDNFEEAIYDMADKLNLEMNHTNNGSLFHVSGDGKLIQCSTKADFYNGERKNFIEFVRRIDGREGFDTNNANGIFKSTK